MVRMRAALRPDREGERHDHAAAGLNMNAMAIVTLRIWLQLAVLRARSFPPFKSVRKCQQSGMLLQRACINLGVMPSMLRARLRIRLIASHRFAVVLDACVDPKLQQRSRSAFGFPHCRSLGK